MERRHLGPLPSEGSQNYQQSTSFSQLQNQQPQPSPSPWQWSMPAHHQQPLTQHSQRPLQRVQEPTLTHQQSWQQPSLAIQPQPSIQQQTQLPDIPDPMSLQEDMRWIPIIGPASQPTAERGDWRTWPHLGGKEAWRSTIGPRAEKMCNLMNKKGFGLDGCRICSAAGHGTQSDFSGHIPGQFHFKHLGQYFLDDGVDVMECREKLSDSWNIPGGAVRWNHVDRPTTTIVAIGNFSRGTATGACSCAAAAG
eukprot:TRINITY_DN46132_c0_g1_i1.p1 TRINITY_DN46132_c0_g1~~TRINITY_DN46132_c0_g1_i1.p1  ORF type:complete len:251 (+),score=45.47 TRINITY_DN46132_c0_g1_i1:56-808(+)